MMLKMGVHPSRIIFAHPCKRGTDIRFAKVSGFYKYGWHQQSVCLVPWSHWSGSRVIVAFQRIKFNTPLHCTLL